MRHTRAHTANRRSHHALKGPRLSTCGKCGAQHLRHRMCQNCGTYRGKEVVDVLSKIEKRAEKRKQKLKSLGLADSTAEDKESKKLDAAELSNK